MFTSTCNDARCFLFCMLNTLAISVACLDAMDSRRQRETQVAWCIYHRGLYKNTMDNRRRKLAYAQRNAAWSVMSPHN
jgi:hypothetical protein